MGCTGALLQLARASHSDNRRNDLVHLLLPFDAVYMTSLTYQDNTSWDANGALVLRMDGEYTLKTLSLMWGKISLHPVAECKHLEVCYRYRFDYLYDIGYTLLTLN